MRSETAKNRAYPLAAADIAALVPMTTLLETLGFKIDTRTRRAPCILHGGDNPSAFSWTDDGVWHCFACGQGGDKLALVQAARRCEFREALAFLGTLAGVDVTTTPKLRRELARRKRERERLQAAAAKLKAVEDGVRNIYREEIRQLESLRDGAANRIKALDADAPERFPNEHEAAWSALAVVADKLPRAVAGYYIMSFSHRRDRTRFALRPRQRDEMIEEAMLVGWLVDDNNHAKGMGYG